MKIKIAILGATSHIAKGLILNFLRDKRIELFLFARVPQKIVHFLESGNLKLNCYIGGFKQFTKGTYDVIINCVGLGTPSKVAAENDTIFNLTEKFDDLALRYLKKHPKILYINFSSGVVNTVSANDIKPEHFYAIAKLYQEAKHRSLNKLNIVDIRVFSYFSRFIVPDSGYFLTDLIKCIREKQVFITTPCDFTRDFLSHEDLFSLVCLILKAGPRNDVVETYSSKPVTKFELLDYFANNYSLRYTIKRNVKFSSPTGQKDRYFSASRKAYALFGYRPKFSSLQVIAQEAKYLLNE